MREGDRVQTPDGPGTIVSFWYSWEGLRRRVDIGVLLDGGQEWRKLYRPTELEEFVEYEVEVVDEDKYGDRRDDVSQGWLGP